MGSGESGHDVGGLHPGVGYVHIHVEGLPLKVLWGEIVTVLSLYCLLALL